MIRKFTCIQGVFLSIALSLIKLHASGMPALARPALPLAFELNRGQAGPAAEFLARGEGYALCLSAGGGAMLHLSSKNHDSRHDAELGLSLESARVDSVGVGENELEGRVSYLVGADPAKWRQGMPTFGRVEFKSVYPGVDLTYYGNQGRLEYDFRLAPGAKPGQITLKFDGPEGVALADNGDLNIQLAGGSVRWQHPVAWQEIDGQKVVVPCQYVLGEGSRGNHGHEIVRFSLGNYNCSEPLVIDPVLLYSTYLGGSSSGGDSANAVTTDAAGNVYFTGTDSSGTFAFPAVQGFLDAGGNAAFVTKLDSTGTNAVFTTFIGGSGNDSGQAIALDSAGHIFLAGNASPGFPITNGFQTASANGFLAELDTSGTNILYSTYIGDSVKSMGVDGSGHAIVAGVTSLASFPVTPGVLRTNAPNGGSPCGFVVKVNPTLSGTNSLVYSTLFGGSGYDGIQALAVDASGDAYFTGTATSTNFPVTPGAFQTNRLGYSDAYVAELNPTGTALVFSTLLGGSGNDGYNTAGIALDADGNVYVTGQTDSKDFPTTPGAAQPTFGGGGPYSNSGDAFVAKFNPTGSTLLWSTYLGGSLDDNSTGITVDSNRNVYVTGDTSSLNFPTRQAAQTPDLFDAYKFAAGATNWTGLAVGSQTINVFAVDPVNSSNVYAGATRGGSEPVLYKSADGGLTWTGSDTGMPANFSVYDGYSYDTIQASVKSLTVDPSNPNVLYAGFSSGAGILKSTNSGGNWFAVTNGLPQLFFAGGGGAGGRVVGAVAVDPHDSQVVFAALGAINNSAGGIFRSADGGQTWSNVLAGASGSVGFVAVDIDSSDSSKIYAASSSQGGFFKSNDGGNTWTNLNTGLPSSDSVQTIAINPANSDNIYVGTFASGIYESLNGGTNWLVTGQNFYGVPSLAFNPSDPNTLYGLEVYGGYDYQGVIVSTNAGTNWTSMDTGIPSQYNQYRISSLTADPLQAGTLYAASFAETQEGFVAKLDATGSLLVYGTYLGGVTGTYNQRANNNADGIAVDGAGNVWVVGNTAAADFPVTTNAYQQMYYGNQSAFIAKLGSTASADLAVTLSTKTNTTPVNQSFIYTAIITNLGPADASFVTLEDVLPPSLAFQSAILSQGGYEIAGQTLAFNLGTVSNGSSATVVFTVTPAIVGTLQNRISVTANENDPVLSNNVASISTTVQLNSALQTDLSMGASVSPNPALLGYNLNYILSVTNLGPDPASGVILTDALPQSVTVVSAGTSQGTLAQLGKNLTATFGDLAPGASASLNVVVTPLSRGTITNVASVTGNESDPNPANNVATTATPVIQASLQVTRSGPVPEQADQSFTMFVTNNGPDAVANTLLTVASPDGTNTILQSVTSSQGSAIISNNLVVASLGSIPSQGFAAVHVSAVGPGNVTAYTIISQVSSSGVVLFTQTNSTVADLMVLGGTVTPNPIMAGQVVTISGFVTNAGPDVAKNVAFLFGLDSRAFNLISMSGPGATNTFYYGNVIYAENLIPELNPGSMAQFTIQAQPFKAVNELIIFAADSDQPDPTPADNSVYDIYEYTNWLHITVTNGPGVLSFAQSGFSAAENSGGAFISIVRQGGSAGAVSVNYATTGGSAKPGVNYTPVTGTLTLAPGQTGASFMVPLLDDGVLSPNLSVNLLLNDPTGGYLGSPSAATLTIDESDFPTNPVGSMDLLSAAITNSPLVYGNNPYPYGAPQVFAVTPDGRHVLFGTLANNLVNGVNNTYTDYNGYGAQYQNVYVRDMNTNYVDLVNATSSGGPGNSSAYGDAITPDGRYVEFESSATDLTPGNDAGHNQVFMRDMVTGQTKIVSLDTNGISGGSSYSYGGEISANGRYVFYTSYAQDLTAQPLTGNGDVFMRDTWSNITTLVSVSTNGATGSDKGSYLDAITPDGRYVVFESYSSNLSPVPATNSVDNLFLRDTVAGTTTLVTVNPAGTQSASGYSSNPGITPDGAWIVFASHATNLTADIITNGSQNVFLRSLTSGSTVLVSVGTNGLAGTKSSYASYGPCVSSNGQFVVFGSYASNLSPLASGITSEEVFVRDMLNGTNRLVSVDAAGTNAAAGYAEDPQISLDGRFVVFDSIARDLTTNLDYGYDNVFVADLASNTMTLASVSTNGSASTGSSQEQITPDGHCVVFESADDTLAPGAPYNTGEIYRNDPVGGGIGATAPVSASFSRTANNNSPATMFSMSSNGRWIAFDSYALNLVQNQTNGNGSIFLADTLSNTLTILNLNTNGALPNNSGFGPMISADGNVVAFNSSASDLVTNPVNDAYNYNVFAYNVTNRTMNLVSVNHSGGSDNGSSSLVGLSTDGRFVVFTSYSTNLTAVTITNNDYWQHLYVRDLLQGTTTMVDVTTNGLPGDSNAGTGSITSDGRFIAFTSASDWLVPGVSNVTGSFQDYQIYRRDMVAGSNVLVSATPFGGPTTNEFGVYYSQPLISSDGRYVVFESSSLDLLFGNTNTFSQVYERDLLAQETRLVSVNLPGTSGGNSYATGVPVMTPDGRFVAFPSYADDLTANTGANNTQNVFVRDTVGKTTTLVSVNDSGSGAANAQSGSPVISSDGRYVVFQSFATDLVPGAFLPGVGNIYRRDLMTGSTILVSGNLTGSGGGSGTSENPVMSSDGSMIGFDSAAYDLTPQDFNQDKDLFVFGFASVSNTADLALDVSAPVSASVGSPFNLVLSVTNLGPTNATGVVVVDTLPPGVNFTSARASQGTPVFSGGQITWNPGNLAVGNEIKATITLTPTLAGIVYNDASVTGNQSDPNPYNNSLQTSVTVSGVAAPALIIARLPGNQYKMSWPASANLELQTTTNLAPPILWQPLTNGIITGGGVNSLTVTDLPGGGNHFYRLAAP